MGSTGRAIGVDFVEDTVDEDIVMALAEEGGMVCFGVGVGGTVCFRVVSDLGDSWMGFRILAMSST